MENRIRLDKTVIDRYKKLDTTAVSDAMDKLGIPCGLYHIKQVVCDKPICGQAFTVHYTPCGSVKGTVGDFLDEVEPGQVIVLDNAGRDYCTVWGDIMSIAAAQAGIEGTIIDGVCRDIPAIKCIDYPIYAKGCYMVTGKDRVFADAFNVPVAISGIQVNPGDIILGDATGAIAVPYEHAEEVLCIAEDIAEKEQTIEQLVKSGIPLKEARAQTGYHSLQTKENIQ